MKIYRYIYTAFLSVLLFVSCDKGDSGVNLPAPVSDSDGNALTLTIDTRSITPGNGDPLNGGGMKDLLVLVVEGENGIVSDDPLDAGFVSLRRVMGREYITYATAATSQEIKFTGLQLGKYTVYAYANTTTSSIINELLSTTTDASVPGVKMLRPDGSGEATDNNIYFINSLHRDQLFRELAGAALPNVGSGNMLITGYQEINIGVGNNSATVELKRPVVHFSFEMCNHSNYYMRINAPTIKFGDFNPSTTYVQPHEQLYSSLVYREMPQYVLGDKIDLNNDSENDIDANGYIDIPPKTDQIIYDKYLYENKVAYTGDDDNPYVFSMDVQFIRKDNYTVYKVDGATVVTDLTSAEQCGNVILAVTDADGNTMYLGDNGGMPEVTPILKTSCMWTIAQSGGGYTIRNNSTGRYLRVLCADQQLSPEVRPVTRSELPVTAAVSLSDISTDVSLSLAAGNVSMFVTGDGTNYYVQADIENETVSLTTTESLWAISYVASPQEDVYVDEILVGETSIERSKMKIVDYNTGVVLDMYEMLRNQKVEVAVNAYFNDKTNEFDYECVPWERVSNEVEFE